MTFYNIFTKHQHKIDKQSFIANLLKTSQFNYNNVIASKRILYIT